MIKVLFVCVHNSARSQIAEAYLNKLGKGYFFAESAGLEPGNLNPDVVKVMDEEGYDLHSNLTKSVFDFYREGRRYHYVIKVCDQINGQKCPIFPATEEVLNWNHEDPASYNGNDEERLLAARRIRDQIKQDVQYFINEHILELSGVLWPNSSNICVEHSGEDLNEKYLLSFKNKLKNRITNDLGANRFWLKGSLDLHNGAWLESLANLWLIYFEDTLLVQLNQTDLLKEQIIGLMKYFHNLYPYNITARLDISNFTSFVASLFESKGLDLKIRERSAVDQKDSLQIELFIQDVIKGNSALLWITTKFESGLIVGYDIQANKIESIYILAEGKVERVDFLSWFELNHLDTQLIAIRPQY